MFRIVLTTANQVKVTRWHMDWCTIGLLCSITRYVACTTENFHSRVMTVSVSECQCRGF